MNPLLNFLIVIKINNLNNFDINTILNSLYLRSIIPSIQYNLERDLCALSLKLFRASPNFDTAPLHLTIDPSLRRFLPLVKENIYFYIKDDYIFINESHDSHPFVKNFRFFESGLSVNTISRIFYFVKQNLDFFTTGNRYNQEKKSFIVLSKLINVERKNSIHLIDLILKKDFNIELLFKNKKHYTTHDYSLFCASFLNNKWSFNSILKLIEIIKNKPNKFIGYCERLEDKECSLFLPTNKDKEISSLVNKIYDEYNVFLRKSDVKYVDKIDISQFEGEAHIKELCSKIDLEVEGDTMGHCVGGYKVRNNNRIFSITSESKRGTLEISLHNDYFWNKVQLRGPSNSVPSDRISMLSKGLVSFLNKNNNNVLDNVFDLTQEEKESIMKGKYKKIVNFLLNKNLFENKDEFLTLVDFDLSIESSNVETE